MCKCTPNIRTPFCGKLGCEWPNKKPIGTRESPSQQPIGNKPTTEDEIQKMLDAISWGYQ